MNDEPEPEQAEAPPKPTVRQETAPAEPAQPFGLRHSPIPISTLDNTLTEELEPWSSLFPPGFLGTQVER